MEPLKLNPFLDPERDLDQEREKKLEREQKLKDDRCRIRIKEADPEAKELITSPNLASMEAFISDLHGDSIRSKEIITYCARHYPITASLKLSRLALSSPHLRADCFDVFVRVLYPEDRRIVFPPTILAAIKPLILECLRQESSTKPVTSKDLSRIVSGITYRVYSDCPHAGGEWPELLEYVAFSIVASDDNKDLQEWGLLIFRYLPEISITGVNSSWLDVVSTKVLHLYSSLVLKLRAAAFRASVNLVKSCSCTRYFHLRNLLPQMISSAEELMASGHHLEAGKALRTIVRIAMEKPRFLIKWEVPFESVVRIAERQDIGEELRSEAIQVLRELEDGVADDMGKMLDRLSDESIERFVRLMVNFLEYVEDDPDHDGAENNTEEKRSVLLGTYFLDRMSFIHERKVLSTVVDLARDLVKDPEWKKRHAGITAVSVIIEGCSEELTDYLGQVLTFVLDLLPDLHLRVRGAVINAIRVLCADFGGSTVQEKCHDRILPALVSALGEPSLQVQAAIALFYFCQCCKPENLVPFLRNLTRRLLIVSRSQHPGVQEWGFRALAMVAISSKSYFIQVYNNAMFGLRDILVNRTNSSEKLVRAKCLKCISHVAVAAGREKFLVDSAKVMDPLMSILRDLTESDHEIKIFTYQALANFYDCLGEELGHYVPELVPILLQSAQIYNLGKDVASTGEDDSSVDPRIEGLKEKALACKVLLCMARQLGKMFSGWTMKVANALVPLLQFSEHRDTKEIAILAMPKLLKSATLSSKRGKPEMGSISLVQKLVLFVVPALSEALEKEPQIKMQLKFLRTIYKCVKVSGTVFSIAQASSISNVIKKVLAAISDRDQHPGNIKDEKDSEMDPEEVKELEEKILGKVTNCLVGLIKRFKSGFLPYFDQLLLYIPMMWDDRRSSREKVMGFYIFRNIVLQCGNDAQKYFGLYLPCVLKACEDGDPSVRQEAALGIGACAESGDAYFKAHIKAALEILESLMRNAANQDNGTTYDAAVSALGKICRFHRDSIEASELVPTWLSCLPLVSDLDEAKLVHEQLQIMIETRDEDLFGPNNQNVPLIIGVLEEIVGQKENLATKATAEKMTSQLLELNAESNL